MRTHLVDSLFADLLQVVRFLRACTVLATILYSYVSIAGFVMIWKFPHAQSDPMLPTQKIDCPAILPDYWVKWIKVDKSSRQLLLNCEEAIVILDEQCYKLNYNFDIDFRHCLPFTACAFYHPSCYFITGEFSQKFREARVTQAVSALCLSTLKPSLVGDASRERVPRS